MVEHLGLRETKRGVGNVGGELGVRVSPALGFILDPHRTIFLAARQERIKPNISDPNGQHGHPSTQKLSSELGPREFDPEIEGGLACCSSGPRTFALERLLTLSRTLGHYGTLRGYGRGQLSWPNENSPIGERAHWVFRNAGK